MKKTNIVTLCITDLNLNQILMINRNHAPYKDYWGLLGGKIKKNELPRDASNRELIEEYGKSLSGRFLGEWEEVVINESEVVVYDFNIYVYHFCVRSPELTHKTKEGELRWFERIDLSRKDIIPADNYILKNMFYNGLRKGRSLTRELDCNKVSGRKKYEIIAVQGGDIHENKN